MIEINEMYKKTIKKLEDHIFRKEFELVEHKRVIEKIVEGSGKEMSDIKLIFFNTE